VTSYLIYWDNGGNGQNWVLLFTETLGFYTFNSTVTNGIIRSNFYKFYYVAVNQQGVGAAS
jgi:hypothetical protein